MRSRRACAVIVGVVGLVLFGAGAPAWASPGDTNTTFDLTSGTLAITVPGSASLGSFATGSTLVSGQLGGITVDDTRAALVAQWTASVASTDFTTGTATANETVSKTNSAYSSGSATSATGSGTFTTGAAASLLVAGTAGAWAGVGNNSVSWNPTVSMTLLGSQVAGTYSGTITHSFL
jgi:hypothetical protein